MTSEATPETAPSFGDGLDQAANAFLSILEPPKAPPEAEKPQAQAEPEPPATEQEAEAEPEAQEAPPETPKKTYKLKAAGQELEVDEDELVKGYQRHQDYKVKTTELAEQRRKLEAEAQAVQQERQQYLVQLQHLIPALQQQVNQEFSDVKTMADLEKLAREDPARFTVWQAKQVALQQAEVERQRLTADQQRQQQEAFRAHVSEQKKLLLEREPAFSKPEEHAALMTYLKAEGYTDKEISSTADHRALIIARKAMLYDKMQKAKPQEKVVPKPAPKVVKPGVADGKSAKDEKFAARMNQLKKTGKLQDAAIVFADLIPE